MSRRYMKYGSVFSCFASIDKILFWYYLNFGFILVARKREREKERERERERETKRRRKK